MTGTLVVLGGPHRGKVDFDTDKPDTIAVCEAIWKATVTRGTAAAFDTTSGAASPPLDRGAFDPQVSETTIIPKFAGGC